jgi:putative transposase
VALGSRSRGCATENPSWAYTRIRGALRNLGHELGRNTIKRILAEHGLVPAPKRGETMPWKTFLEAHFGVIAATDFFTVEVLTLGGLVRYVVLFVSAPPRDSRRAAMACRGAAPTEEDA